MSDIKHRNHTIEEFINWFLNQVPIPQTAIYYHNSIIKIVVQYVPNKGCVLGFQDDRLPNTQNPVMEWVDLVYLASKKKNVDMRELVMHSTNIQEALASLTTGTVNKRQSFFNLMEGFTSVIHQAELAYKRNTLLLNH